MIKNKAQQAAIKAAMLAKSKAPTQDENVKEPQDDDSAQDATEASLPVENVQDTAPVAEPAPVEPDPEPIPSPDPEPVSPEPVGVSAGLVKALSNYIERMALNMPLSMDDGVKQQKLLQSAIINGLTIDDDVMAKENIRYILLTIHNDATGCFSMRAIFRFYDVVRWSNSADRREIETLISLFINTADSKTRQEESNMLDWARMGELLTPQRSETIIRRLSAVYGRD